MQQAARRKRPEQIRAARAQRLQIRKLGKIRHERRDAKAAETDRLQRPKAGKPRAAMRFQFGDQTRRLRAKKTRASDWASRVIHFQCYHPRMHMLMISIIALSTQYPLQVSNPMDKLGMQEGRWAYTERDYQTPYSSAHTNNGTSDCNWAPNRGFMVCDYLNGSPSNGVPANDLAVFSYNAAAHTYGRLGILKTVGRLQTRYDKWGYMDDVSRYSLQGKHAHTAYRSRVFARWEARERDNSDLRNRGKTWTTISRFTAAKIGPSRA